MVSLAVKSHWKLAYKAVKKAIKVTIQEAGQYIKSTRYHLKVKTI